MSIESCGKPITSPSRGKTYSGFDLSGMNWREARTVAVDPNIIPLNSKILIIFQDKNFKKFDGIYICRDTGIAIKGNKIDFYMGDTIGEKELNNFGVREAKIYIIKE